MTMPERKISTITAILIFTISFLGGTACAQMPVTLSTAKGLFWRFFANAQNDTGGVAQNDTGAVAQDKEVLVAAASDLYFAMNEIVNAFEADHQDINVRVSYGSSGNLFAQVRNGAPFDVYFSADIKYPELLEKDGLIVPGTKMLYAIGRLVLWVPEGSAADIKNAGLNVLTRPSIRRIAIANPRHAPYGRAAVEAMQNAGIYEEVKGKLVLGENVSHAAQFVQSGAADIGIIALSIALSPSMQASGRFWEIPDNSYSFLEQGYAILRDGNNPEATKTFTDFFSGPEGRRILELYGFHLPFPKKIRGFNQ